MARILVIDQTTRIVPIFTSAWAERVHRFREQILGTEFDGIPTSDKLTPARSRKRPFEVTPAERLGRSVFVQLTVNLGTALVVTRFWPTLASIDSPTICGWTIDRTSSRDLPFRCLMAPALA